MINNKFLNLVSSLGTFILYLSIFSLMFLTIFMLLIGAIGEQIKERWKLAKENKKQLEKDIIYPKEHLSKI